MQLWTLAVHLVALVAIAAGQSDYFPVDPSTITDCAYYQNWPDPLIPEQGNTCAEIAAWWLIEEQDFIEWNPIVGPNCENLAEQNAYCIYMHGYWEGEEQPPLDAFSTANYKPSSGEDDSPDPSSQTADYEDELDNPTDLEVGLDGENGSLISSEDCTQTAPAQEDCAVTAALWFISEADFIALNPSVGSACADLIPGDFYCVQAHTHPLLDSAAAPDCDTHVPYPDKGLPPMVQREQGSTCESFANFWFIKESDFKAWNPAVGKECENFEEGKRYCIWVRGATRYYDAYLGNETTTSADGDSTATSGGATTGTVSASTPSTTSSPETEGAAGLRSGGSGGIMQVALAMGLLEWFLLL